MNKLVFLNYQSLVNINILPLLGDITSQLSNYTNHFFLLLICKLKRGMELSSLKCYTYCTKYIMTRNARSSLFSVFLSLNLLILCLYVYHVCENRNAHAMAHTWKLQDNFQE